MAHGTVETEIKLRVADIGTARRLLRAAGFRVWKRRIFESNDIFDTPALTLRKRTSLLRVREAGSAKLTYKGPPAAGRYKSREELEIDVSDPAMLATILGRIGFHRTFRYEKYRTEFQQRTGRGIATLDETPIGIFVELEGAPSWIDRTARRMGFRVSDYITESYGGLYFDWCKQRGIKTGDMVFGGRAG